MTPRKRAHRSCFYAETNRIRLQQANPEVAPLVLSPGEIQILGVVTGLVRMGG